MSERWLPVPGSEGYEVSDQGRVRNARTGRLLAGHSDRGYRRVNLGAARRARVHELVLLAFVGPRPEGLHGDGDRANNALANLRWGTRAENCADTVRHGRSTRGDRSWGWLEIKATPWAGARSALCG